MAGPELTDALRREEELRGRSVSTVIGYWNSSDEEPDAVAAAYAAALTALAGRPDVELACKVPALDCDTGRVDALARQAGRAGVPLHFDSLSPEEATSVLAATVDAGAGATLPGRWARSPGDAERLGSTDLTVRVIKGQWADPADPRRDLRMGFLAVIDRLAGRDAPVGVATHDGPLAAEALRRLRIAGTPCELQLLLGLPAGASVAAAREADVGVRVYVSYGAGFLPYALKAMARRPSVALRLAADLMRGSSRESF